MSIESTDHPPLVQQRLLTVADYHRMAEAGIFAPDERVELIEGVIVNMPPIGPEHSGLVNVLTEALVTAFAGKAVVSVQNPVILPEHSEPEPDFALLRWRADKYRKATPLPADVLLLVEVANSTLRYDTEIKRPLYAAHGVPEYWIVDVQGERLTRFTEPEAGDYRRTETLKGSATVELVALPGETFDLSELF